MKTCRFLLRDYVAKPCGPTLRGTHPNDNRCSWAIGRATDVVRIGIAGALLAGTLLRAQPSLSAPSTDRFVPVAKPGWVNTSQYSVTGAWGDYDKDGFIDLFVANSTDGWGPAGNFLYRNNRDGTFTPMSAAKVGAVVTDREPSIAGYWGDFNNDGRLDLFALSTMATANSGPVLNRLYLNLGNGAFASANGGDLTQPCYAGGWAAVADYDNDGWLDVYVSTAWAEGGRRTNLLYHACGDGRFKRVTDSPVVRDQISSSFTLSALWGDYDNDGDQDLVVANYGERDCFYRNEGGGRFIRLTNSILEKPGYGTMHQAWGDYDNDGFLDLASGCGSALRLFRNDGGSDFLVATNWAIGAGDWYSGVPVWGDYDNDGHLDLLSIKGQAAPRRLCLYHNNGDGTFDQVEEAFTRPTGHWLGGGWGDYDNDGFLDLFVANHTGQNALYHNEGNGNHWLKVLLEGHVSNGAAIGAKVRVRATIAGKTVWQMREVSGGNFCQNDLRLNFGLGDATVAEVIRVEWPSGNVQEISNEPVDQIKRIGEVARIQPPQPSASLGGAVTLRSLGTGPYQWRFNGVDLPGETGGTLSLKNLQASQAGRYSVVVTSGEGTTVTNFTYLQVDTQFTKITTESPVTDLGCSWGAAWGDADGDGFADLFVARQGSAVLYRNDQDGTFTTLTNGPFPAGPEPWTSGAWADFDNDGRQDLLATRLGESALLYFNDGDGSFSPVGFARCLNWGTAVADYSRDGLLDLLLSTGVTPASGGIPCELFRNNGDRTFTKVTLQEAGPIVSAPSLGAASWADYDDDGLMDAFSACATGSSSVFHNQGNGQFVSAKNQVTRGAAFIAGAWGDYDNDGRLDLCAAAWNAQAVVYRNLGGGEFAVAMVGPEIRGNFSSCSWADYDNDGFLDLFLAGADNVLLRNDGGGSFTRIKYGIIPTDNRVGGTALSYSALWFDYDHNGALDLYVSNGDDPRATKTANFFYHNNGNENHWLQVRLVGTVSNRDAVGAKVRVRAVYGGKMRWQRRDISSGDGYNGNHRYAHFGLAEARGADIIRIEWPSGTIQELRNVPANQILTVTEPPALEALGEGRLRILCWAHQNHEVEVSDDLQTWTSLGGVATDQHRPVVLDPGAADHPHRFYRAKR
ncbi:MAG: VCBS repeat-containing protein [Verrucomicrobiales bacterium]|nr:VCBS repeat-containing protein [Verrucomicrobiales bacterium]